MKMTVRHTLEFDMKLLSAHLRVAVVAVALSFTAGGALARDDAAAAVTSLTDKFLEAQRSFDLPAIRALSAENYVEIFARRPAR